MNKKILLGLLCIASLTAWAFFDVEPYIVSGIVTDQYKRPIAGVSVSEVGVNNQTMTDSIGAYSITIKNGKARLRFSTVGYNTQEIKTTHSLTQDIVLKTAVSNLDEVVVVGYGSAKRKDLSGAVISISPSSLYKSEEVYNEPSPNEYDSENALSNSREGYDGIVENRFKKVTDNPLSTFSIDVDGAAYSNTRRFINNGSLPPAGAVRIEEMINYFHYDYPQPIGEHPFSINTEMTECPWNTKHRLALIGLQGKKMATENLPPSNLVFLIDVSGSMDEPNKLPLVKASMKMLAEQLRSDDRVAIVVYAGSAGLALPPVNGSEKNMISKAIDNLQAGGSTAGGAGIQLAYKTAKEYFNAKGNNRVILCTDGDFNVGASSDDALERMIETERQSGIFLSVLGFGMGNYQDAKMQKLADKGNGNHNYIDDVSEAKKVLVSEFGGTLFTIAKDVKLQVEFNPGKVQAYRLIGYENRMLNKEDFNNDKKDAGELGSGHTVTALYEIIPVGIEDDMVEDLDDLKYQQPSKAITGGNELMTIKFRYKKPNEDKSILMVHPVVDENKTFATAGNNLRFAAAVAEFGMLLRNSEFKENASYKNVLVTAKGALGDDVAGYRSDFIKLVENARSLSKKDNEEDLGAN
jgi:Ca-activated chloride channel family protein